MKEFIKSLFGNKVDDSLVLSRRQFITGAAGLAALTVVGSKLPSILKIKELAAQIASGRVYGQTFYVSETIVIDIPNVVIDQCEFIATQHLDPMLHLTGRAHYTTISNCLFTNKYGGDILIDPQGDIDMTQTFESAFALGAPTIKLTEGAYKLDSPMILPSTSKFEGVRYFDKKPTMELSKHWNFK